MLWTRIPGQDQIKTHRAAIRLVLGYREATVEDAQQLAMWMTEQRVPAMRNHDVLRVAVYTRYRELRIDPPTSDRVDRLVRSAVHTYDLQFCTHIMDRLSAKMRTRLDALLHVTDSSSIPPVDDGSRGSRSLLSDLKADPGPLTVATVEQEVAKLVRIQQIALPADLFTGIAPNHLDAYRQRIVAEELHEVRRHPDPVRYTLLAAFCWLRSRELTDTLGELLMDMIHHLGTKAERKVEQPFLQDLKRVSGKTTLLFQLAEAVVAQPDGIVREVLFPVVGEKTLRDLVKEYRATGMAYQQQVQTRMRASYRHHYRRMIPLILQVLSFDSQNTAHRPVLAALALLKHYAVHPSTQPFFSKADVVPLDSVVRPSWRDLVVKRDSDGTSRSTGLITN